MTTRGRPRQIITDEDHQRWANIRREVAASEAEDFSSRLNDLPVLDVLAWLVGKGSVHRIDETVAKAREEGETWAAIASALGEAGDRAAHNRIASRYRIRSKASKPDS